MSVVELSWLVVVLIIPVTQMLTMLALMIASAVAWCQMGNAQLRLNWIAGQATSARGIAHQIFDGICVGMLGLTGFECVPTYIAHIKPGRFPSVLRNLHLSAIALNSIMMMLVLAVVPLEHLKEANVLSVLAETVGSL
jgi:hypothetical protein